MSAAILGGIGAAAAALASVAYITSILRGRTRPHRVTWGAWTAIGVLGVVATHSAGAGAGAWVVLVLAITTGLVFLLSLNPRVGKPNAERPADWYCGGVALGTLIIWQAAALPAATATLVAIACDAVISWPTVREAWLQPQYESVGAWGLGLLASILGLLALSTVSFASAAYPAYIGLLQAVLVGTLLLRRRGREPASVLSERL